MTTKERDELEALAKGVHEMNLTVTRDIAKRIYRFVETSKVEEPQDGEIDFTDEAYRQGVEEKAYYRIPIQSKLIDGGKGWSKPYIHDQEAIFNWPLFIYKIADEPTDETPICPTCGHNQNMILHGDEWVCHGTHRRDEPTEEALFEAWFKGENPNYNDGNLFQRNHKRTLLIGWMARAELIK